MWVRVVMVLSGCSRSTPEKAQADSALGKLNPVWDDEGNKGMTLVTRGGQLRGAAQHFANCFPKHRPPRAQTPRLPRTASPGLAASVAFTNILRSTLVLMEYGGSNDGIIFCRTITNNNGCIKSCLPWPFSYYHTTIVPISYSQAASRTQ